jgi:UDP-glucose 4-epimerase
MEELKAIITKRLQNMDLNQRKGDFAHLLFNEANADRILQFQEVIEGAL